MRFRVAVSFGSHTNLLCFIRPSGADIYMQGDIWLAKQDEALKIGTGVEPCKRNIQKAD